MKVFKLIAFLPLTLYSSVPVTQPAQNIKLLLVDDEIAVRDLYQIALEKHGLTVFTAAGVREALQALHDLQFDAALIDLQLQDGDGMEIIRRVKQTGGPKVLAMSGYPLLEQIERDLRSQKVPYYNKLQPLAELIHLIALETA